MSVGKHYEFESTTLEFKEISEKYEVWDVQLGFYVDGVKYEKCQCYDNWEENLGGMLL